MDTTDVSLPHLTRDFWKFWAGQTISNFGSSLTAFALPLLIYKLTGSALSLALATMSTFLPYLLFGLFIGAWVDRLNRKRLMIAVNILNATLLATIPLLSGFELLSIWWIYTVGFITSTLTIAFHSAEFAAIPSLVDQKNLVTANGRIQASYSAAAVVGPLLAGVAVAYMSIAYLLLFDSLSFLLSSLALWSVRTSFNVDRAVDRPATSVRQDVVAGLRYVLGHPVLRNISLMMALVNFVGSTVTTQLVLFAQRRLEANDTEVGWLYSAGSVGIVLLSLLAGMLRRHWSFSRVALSALMLEGVGIVLFSFLTSFWAAVIVWALISGLGVLFNINTGSLRQSIVPNEMLGRVMSIAGVLAWSAIPLGTLIGGWVIETTGDVVLVYRVIGGLVFIIPLVFSMTALGRAEQYLPQVESSTQLQSA